MRSFIPYFLSVYQTNEGNVLKFQRFLRTFPVIVRRNYHTFWNYELKHPFFFNYSHSLENTPEGVRLNVQNQEYNGILTEDNEVGGLSLSLKTLMQV